MATRRRVSRKNIVNTISDTERRLAYVEKLPTKTSLADGSVTTAKIANSSITKQKVVFGTVNPIADIPGAGSVTAQAENSLYFDSGTGSLVGVDDSGNQIPVIDSVAQEDATTAIGNAATALTSANGKNKVFHQGTTPTNIQISPLTLKTGDLWFDTSSNNRMGRYDEATASFSNFSINSLSISSIDAGQITTGTLSGRSLFLKGGQSNTLIGSIKSKKMTYDVAILETFSNPSGFSSGQEVVISGLGAPFDGSVIITSAVDDAIIYRAIISGNTDIEPKVNAYAEITNKVITNNIVTLTTASAHGFAANSIGIFPTVTITSVDATINGTHEITAVTVGSGNHTFSFRKVTSNVASTAVSPYGKAYPTITKVTFSNDYEMTLSPSLDVSLFPVYDGNTADKIVSPGISVSQTFAGNFAGLTDVVEVHSVVGAYSSGSTTSAVFGSVFGVSTTAANYQSPGALGAGMNVSIDGTETVSFGGGRAPAIVELYGDIVKLRHINDYLVGNGSNIAHNGTDLVDYRTVLKYTLGVEQGEGGIQPGTIAWTTSAVTGITLTGGVAGDLVFKYTV